MTERSFDSFEVVENGLTEEQILQNPDCLISSHDENHPANVICKLCEQFFHNNWCTGTGGGISIKDPKTNYLYIAPSGVQKEKMKREDLFVLNETGDKCLRKPSMYKPSACTPLFLACYKLRNAGAIIHTHSQHAVMCSLIFKDVFRISNIEQIKAIPSGKIDPVTNKQIALSFFDTLEIPIIENMAHEDQLIDSFHDIFKRWPHTQAIIVRRHGIFVWGSDINKAKIYNEAIDYLMELAVKMYQIGIPPDCGIGEEKRYLEMPM
ncbi:hypothetical protein Kpol_1050p40 [Vanderwaltozyma polyspora DSM 70294]|uniref:Methylthioribulose-1-phosphate dehydratase n=1 Tax=Vanderwaltozyma polyspora (strain ATCC 22028 / DSM 70294 / BCRC 21397 / CBS 2163 / NBRC 10782 / NRRL Y-8283 / UCD 57-17) TaxID=436907 RepID=MTNB_VANPO|nr:uncharacterized protein Kpol_1050p40 [Vanderwaltozyma polyspora DSM 70294]A7TET7.1 RecName: Full=Methylthioribulose-1-phosphate dehydratase; Short=MTRu-1-P dehydratase [Vanderwaltozyma polyspora DSM 70294]EDO19183.1 hypothetical protein Kpol_1050p40 [Vanderwaltozyma polyspora DSM 70294]